MRRIRKFRQGYPGPTDKVRRMSIFLSHQLILQMGSNCFSRGGSWLGLGRCSRRGRPFQSVNAVEAIARLMWKLALISTFTASRGGGGVMTWAGTMFQDGSPVSICECSGSYSQTHVKARTHLSLRRCPTKISHTWTGTFLYDWKTV